MINIKNVNVLSSVPKCDVVKTNNLHIVTRQDTKNGIENPQTTKLKNNDNHPNPTEQKKLYNNTTTIFQELTAQENIDKVWQKDINEFLKLIIKEESNTKLIDITYEIQSKK